jgi:Zn-dependent oligopeptidase
MQNFSSYADFKLKNLMAKNASTVEHFLEDLARKTIVTAHHDYLETQSIKR